MFLELKRRIKLTIISPSSKRERERILAIATIKVTDNSPRRVAREEVQKPYLKLWYRDGFFLLPHYRPRSLSRCPEKKSRPRFRMWAIWDQSASRGTVEGSANAVMLKERAFQEEHELWPPLALHTARSTLRVQR